jgi:hypothetical protein
MNRPTESPFPEGRWNGGRGPEVVFVPIVVNITGARAGLIILGLGKCARRKGEVVGGS